ncbi:MAG: hypothetical protein Q4C97_01485 [Bacillota bacterium]|nr:hypothetical protein [Bacillota bacterium]
MNYEVVKNKEGKHRWRDQNWTVWYYIHWKEAEQMQIDLGKIFADIGNKKENNGSNLNSNGRILLLTEKREQLLPSERVLGYIPCKDAEGNFGYVRILKKKQKVVWFILLLLLAILIGGGTWWFWNRKPKVNLDESTIAYQMPNGLKNENPSEIMIPVFSKLIMQSENNKVTAGLVNPEGNPCYFQYKIYLQEGEKLLYESKWLEPGTAIMEFEIQEKLKTGEYSIIIKIKTGSLKDPEVEMNGGEVEAILQVE